jgi:hypothetical protein
VALGLNLPNSITLLRILLVPVFITLLFVSPEKSSLERWFVVVIFVVKSARFDFSTCVMTSLLVMLQGRLLPSFGFNFSLPLYQLGISSYRQRIV